MGPRAIAVETETPAECRLVPRARAGEIDAFEELYRRWVGRVHGLCLRMTGDPSRAEDCTQETFIRAWRKLGAFRGDCQFPAWLCRVAIRVVLSDRRSRARRPEADRPFNDPGEPGRVARRSAVAALDLERAIQALPEGAREVFVLHHVEGFRHEEIARMLDVTPGTSKSQLHRARKLLMEMLR